MVLSETFKVLSFGEDLGEVNTKKPRSLMIGAAQVKVYNWRLFFVFRVGVVQSGYYVAGNIQAWVAVH